MRLSSLYRASICTFIALVFAPSLAYSQDIDSLYAVFSDSKGATRISAANEIIDYVYAKDYVDSLIILKIGDNEAFVNATIHNAMGFYLMLEKGDYTRSNDFFILTLEYYEKKGDAASVNIINGEIGGNYFRMGDFANAVAYKMKCYEWERNANDPEALSNTLHDLGVIYGTWKRHDLAIRFLEEAERVERPLNRPLQYANRLASLAKQYILGSDDDISKSLPLIKEALQYDEKIEIQSRREDRIATHLFIMGEVYSKLDSLEQAASCFQQALDFFEKRGQPYYTANILMQLGHLKVKSRQYVEAVELLKRSEEMAAKNNYLVIYLDACLYLSEAYSHLEPNSLSYYYLDRFRLVNQAVVKRENQQQIDNFQTRYETIEKQFEIERQQIEIERQKDRLLLFTGGLIASFLLLAMLVYIVILRTRRNRQLSEINAIKDKFFSIISHDLKNPVIAQRDALQTLVDYRDQLDANTLSEFIRKMLKSAEGLADLLKNLLDWAKIQTNREIFHPVPINLVSALQSDIEVIKSMAEHKEIVFEIEMPPTAVVTADPNMLVTVIRNLLTNAVKFTTAGGKVSLQINKCNDKYSVTVSDSGIGMTQEHVQNLFRLDRQLLREGTSGEQSSGLGLIVCHDILLKHGCKLHVESEEGKGSRFWFEV